MEWVSHGQEGALMPPGFVGYKEKANGYTEFPFPIAISSSMRFDRPQLGKMYVYI